jgi:hypothetical protein
VKITELGKRDKKDKKAETNLALPKRRCYEQPCRRSHMTARETYPCRFGILAIIAAGFLSPGWARAQVFPFSAEQLLQKPVVPGSSFFSIPDEDPVQASPTPRLRMFGMPTGFLANPFGLVDDDDLALTNDPANQGQKDDDLRNLQIVIGSDNPYFDLLRPGNPGGIGYTRVYSQYQVFDSGTTSLCLNMLAYAPTGLQNGGIANGPTTFCPAISCFHDLGQGTALQGFVCQNVNARPGWEDNWSTRMFYGLAWQCPLLGIDKDQGVFFFVQAMGRFYTDENTTRPAMTILPGIHWRVGDNCWLSVGGTRHGIISWAWQF